MTDSEKKELLAQYEPFQKDLDFIDRYCKAENAASGSEVDPNSNVRNKNVATLESEIHKKKNIFANRLRMFNTIKEISGEDLAYQYLYDLEHHIIYRNDETGLVGKPYCAAISLYPLLVSGLKGVGGQSEAPKNLESYCGNYINLVFAVSALILGACATPEFLTIFDYFARKDMGEDYWQHPDRVVFDSPVRKRTIDQYICDKFQQVVYSLNQPAGSRTYQSPFINFSYFSKDYFNALFNGYYFPDGTQPKWESLQWLQKRFMKWFNEERRKVILAFPVETFSILNDGENFPDEDSFDWIAQMYSEGHSFFTYTSNTVDSLSSCCYTDDTMVFVKIPPINKEKEGFRVAVMTFAELEEDMKKYGYDVVGVWSRDTFAPGRLVRLPNRPVYKIVLETGEEIKVTDNHRNYIKGEEKPVLTKDLKVGQCMCLYNIKSSPVSQSWSPIASIERIDYTGDTYCFEMCDREDDMFTLANGVHNYNCRLRNGIDLEENVFSYSLGAGSIQTGSLCVITLNINRAVQDAKREGRDISDLVAERVSRIHKYLLAFRKILQDMIDAHMIPIYEEPMFIDPNKCYLTVGINGLNEGAEFLGIEPSNNEAYQRYVASILKPIYELNKADRIPGKAKFNCEIIPGESVGVRFRKWDAKDGYWVPDRIAYNSYIYRSDDPNIQPTEKFVMHGENYTQWLDGGSALHLNLNEHLTKEQYKHLLKLAAKNKTGLFTMNIPNTVCKSCGHISKHYLQKCPECGSEDVDYATRPIGYLTLVSRWSLERQAEFKKRYFADPQKVEEVKND